MSLVVQAAKRLLADPELFSKLVLRKPLRAYQMEPAREILSSILHAEGREFVIIFPRQAGKDELIAQLQTYLLNLFQRQEAGIVHVYPTIQQIPIGTARLEARLRNDWNDGKFWSKGKPDRRGLGRAQVTFFSGHPDSKSEGATANLLLIINEAQDQLEYIVDRRFVMMTASTNATRLYVGTVRTTSDLLWRKKLALERLQLADGKRRVFVIGPEAVGAENPNYQSFVEAQVAEKGRNHPAIITELFLEPLDASGSLFDDRRRSLMLGKHRRERTPAGSAVYAALVDVGGQDEQATEAYATLANPKRDYTVCTIVQIIHRHGDRPAYQVVDVWTDQGSKHFEDKPGRPSLAQRLNAYLDHWTVAHTVCDASGVGAGLANWLEARRPNRVTPFNFAKPGSKAKLGSDFLALIETGRFRYYGDEQDPDAETFFLQAKRCTYHIPEGGAIESHMQWSVPASATYPAPDGSNLPVHDDHLLSAALAAVLDTIQTWGAAESAVIAPYDPLERSGW